MRRGPVMGQDEAAQEVVAAHGFAPPEEGQHARRADLLAGVEGEVRAGHAGGEAELIGALAGERGGPLAGPADGEDHALGAEVEVEEGQDLGGGAAAAGLEAEGCAGEKGFVDGGEVVDGAEGSVGVVEDGGGGAGGEGEGGVQGQDVFEDGCRGGARVLEVEHPLDRREVAEAGRLGAHFEARGGIGVGRGDEGLAGGGLGRARGPLPGGK